MAINFIRPQKAGTTSASGRSVSHSGFINNGDAAVLLMRDVPDGEVFRVNEASLVLSDGQPAPTDLKLLIITLDGAGGSTSQSGIILGDGSTQFANVTGDPISFYENSTGSPQTVAVVVDNGQFGSGTGSTQDTSARAVVETTTDTLQSGGATGSIVWETASDWDAASSEDGLVHESVANTDHDDAGTVKQGYTYNFDFITPTPTEAYPLQEDSGTTANDIAGTQDATYNNVTLGAGGLLGNSAPDFDGSTSYVICPDVMMNYISGEVGSVTFWMFLDSTAGFQRVVDENNNTDGTSIFMDGSVIDYRLENGDALTQNSSGSVGTGTWLFVAATHGSNNDWNTYLDAASTGSDNGFSGPAPWNTNIMRRGDGAEYTDGRITEVRFYDGDELTASQIQTLYDVVNTAGTLTTDWKTLNGDATELITDSSIPANTTANITVEQDVGSDGIANNSESVSLSGGDSESNSLTSFADENGRYRLSLTLDNTDPSQTASLSNATLSA